MLNTKLAKSFSLLIVIFFLANGLYAADKKSCWPQFHGPNRDNISTEKGLLKQWPDKGLDLLWTVKGLGHGFSSVSIASSIIYTAGNIADEA